MLKIYEPITFNAADFHSTLLHFRHPLTQLISENQDAVIFAKNKKKRDFSSVFLV